MQDLTASFHGAKIFSKMDLLVIFSGTSSTRGHHQTCHCHALRVLRLRLLHLRPEERGHDLPEVRGLHPRGPGLLRQRYPNLFQIPGGTPATHPEGPAAPVGKWPRCQVRQVYLQRREGGIPGQRDIPRGRLPNVVKGRSRREVPHPYLHQGCKRIPRDGQLLQRIHPGDCSHHGPSDRVLKGCPKSTVWGPDQQKAFLLTKAALAKAPSLAHQNPNAPPPS
ncbi:uncharacterized protein [Macrobrachium rosenbergii]|uniref:uncharacterized protein n=1 Tax=Macrobrachium rosenbergii TaxID=79674 RepID=UPI0034D40CD7